MSILIKGMGMPKNCIYCPMSHWNKLDEITGCEIVIGKKYVDKSDTGFWQEDRPQWCPLVEIPKHGRLIDADDAFGKGAFLKTYPTIIEGDTESDLISRQDAINVMCNKVCGVDYCGCATDCDEIKGIMELPSAERTVAHIGDFTQYQIDWLTAHDDLELEPELESWVIRFLKDTADCYEKEYLTSAERTGEWRHYEGTLTCSSCHEEIYDDIMEYLGDDVPIFCPYCGADMRGEEDANN